MEDFLRKEKYPVVVKPVESAGSDGVKLCNTFDEAKEHFDLLIHSQQRVGGSGCHAAVLCQEFLRGKEYVVDHVSRDGVHKTTMCWVYDKRPANGAAFVYFGLLPVDAESPEAKLIIPYIRGVLDALGLKNGPSHGEVMITDDGPCLIEMNCRAHGGDGNWIPLVRGLNGGYTQVSATLDAYTDAARFDALPDRMPSPFLAAGQECIVVSYSKGTVRSTPGYDVIRQLPSFVRLESRIQKGSEVTYSTDLFSDAGSVILMHRDEEVVKKDLAFIRYMEEINGLFIYEKKQESLTRPRNSMMGLPPTSPNKNKNATGAHRRAFTSDGPSLIRHQSLDRPEFSPLTKRMTTVDASKEAVIVVDPYSTGCCIAKEIMKRTYTVVAVWSKKVTAETKEQVPLGCSSLAYHAEISETDSCSLQELVAAIQQAAKHLRVVACICGGESGVELTDNISKKLQLRGNDIDPRRTSKSLQQEHIGAAGLRSIRQAYGKTFSEVESFLFKESFPVVVKPSEYVGFDGAKLCHDLDEAKHHFELLMAVQKERERHHWSSAGVVVQEFLHGQEFLVDAVSRNGQHKTVMVWAHDKRPANGAPRVYFGLIPVESGSIEATLVVNYAKAALTRLGVKQGPSHTSIMLTDTGPCLLEMTCNARGDDGTWLPLARALTGGYTQVDATVDAYLDQKQFSVLPECTKSFKAAGQEVILVSYSRGQVKATPGFDIIRNLHSFLYMETGVQKGSEIDYTVDPFTGIGSVILMHEDKNILQEDLRCIRQMEKNNTMFEYETGVGDGIMRSPSTGKLPSLSDVSIGNGTPKQVFTSRRTDVFW